MNHLRTAGAVWGRGLAMMLSVGSVLALGLATAISSPLGQDPGEPGKIQVPADDKPAPVPVPAPAVEPKKGDPSVKDKARVKKGGLRVPVGAVPKKRRMAADPLAEANANANGNANAAGANPGDPAKAKNANANVADANAPRFPIWPFHYTLKISGADRQPIQAAYYPAKLPFQAPVLILLHESGQGRSSKDFDEPIEDLKGKSLVRYLQQQGFALLTIDLRGHGGNPRHALTPAEMSLLVGDVQAAYEFLVDRHNRGELNLGKLGVIAVGDASNVAVAWTAAAGGGVSSEGRLSDIGALILISPVADFHGLTLGRLLPAIASRVPILAVCGDKDETSIQPLLDNERVIERHHSSKVAYFDTSLHGSKLLTFFPKVATGAAAFLEDPVKSRSLDWEPRYLLQPVGTDAIRLMADSGFGAVGQAANMAAAKAAAPPPVPNPPKAEPKRP